MWQVWSLQAVCPDNQVSVKANHVCIVDKMLKGEFVAKTSSLKPRPSLLYLKVQINENNVLCLVDARATDSFMSLKFAKKLGSPTRRVDKSINMRFAKGELHETKDVALHMTLKRRTLEFVESFILMRSTWWTSFWGALIFKTYTVHVRRKPVRLVMCHNRTNMNLKLTIIPIAGGDKLKFVSMDQINNEQVRVVVQMEQLQGFYGETKNDGSFLKNKCG